MMCGIIFEIRYQACGVTEDENVIKRIMNRGPNCNKTIEISLGNGIKVVFCGAVLWMQGPAAAPQPVETEHGILLYNGDIFDETWDKSQSDTAIIAKMLTSQNVEGIVEKLKTLKGPFSIIYYDKTTQNVYFTRDRIGRNTLLFHKSENSIVISSVLGRRYQCIEIPATNIHNFCLKTNNITLHSWEKCGSKGTKIYSVNEWVKMLKNEQSLPDDEFRIDLNNIMDLELEDNDGIVDYIERTAKDIKCKLTLMKILLENDIIQKTVSKITELLRKSVKIRLDTQPQKCKNCLNTEFICHHCTVGLLFSGGLDCTILAFLADKYIPTQQSIELLNVAFRKEEKGSYDVPDRVTGRQSFEELKKLCPSRNWVFREINVPKEELEMLQKSVIADLVYPRQTILDESLGSALWFAARGQYEQFVSSCRILLLGSGADELFGGYTRHRNAFKRRGWAGLHQELCLDWGRISFRNLARDNRVIGDHGRQPRMPYLDEDLTDYVLNLKPWLKCFPNEELGQGIGDKLILRLVAFNLGLSNVVTFPKRALQFGSKIANKKEKGSDLSKTFTDFKIND